MLHPDRLQFESELFKRMVYSIDENYFKSSKTTFADLQAAGGQYVEQIVKRLKEYGHTDENIKGRVFAFSENYVNLIIMQGRNKDNPIIYKLYGEIDELAMKFDVGIINPPYSNGMHNKFFIRTFEALNDGGTMTCIHPSNYALTKSERIDQYESRVREIVQDYESTIEFIDGNPHFKNAHFFGPLCITTVTKNKYKPITIKNTHLSKPNNIISNIEDVYVHGDLELVKSIVTKVKSKGLDTFHSKNTKFITSGPMFLQLPGVCGHPMKDGKANPDFSCLVYKKDQSDYNSILTTEFKDLKNGRGLNVLSDKHAKNAFDYMKQKFTRFMLSTEKNGQNVWSGTMLKAIPYLDFSKPWSSSEIYQFFNLSKKEISLIETYIEDYYDIDFE